MWMNVTYCVAVKVTRTIINVTYCYYACHVQCEKSAQTAAAEAAQMSILKRSRTIYCANCECIQAICRLTCVQRGEAVTDGTNEMWNVKHGDARTRCANTHKMMRAESDKRKIKWILSYSRRYRVTNCLGDRIAAIIADGRRDDRMSWMSADGRLPPPPSSYCAAFRLSPMPSLQYSNSSGFELMVTCKLFALRGDRIVASLSGLMVRPASSSSSVSSLVSDTLAKRCGLIL